MQKNVELFNQWNVLKQAINQRAWESFVQNGDVWFCSVGLNIGFEEDGKNDNFERPVLVLKKLARGYFWGIPLTSKIKYGYYSLPIKIKDKEVTALIMQLRMYDCRRLRRKIGSLPPTKLALVKQNITDLLWKK